MFMLALYGSLLRIQLVCGFYEGLIKQRNIE
jgi:hypothetical protein